MGFGTSPSCVNHPTVVNAESNVFDFFGASEEGKSSGSWAALSSVFLKMFEKGVSSLVAFGVHVY